MVFIWKITSDSRSRSLQASPALFCHLSALKYVFWLTMWQHMCIHAYLNSAYFCILLFHNNKIITLFHFDYCKQRLCARFSAFVYKLPITHSSKNITPRVIAFAIKMKLERTGKKGKAPQWDFYHPQISWHRIHLWWGRPFIRSSILGIPWAAAKVLTDLSPKTDVLYTPTPLQLFNFSMDLLSFSLHFGG